MQLKDVLSIEDELNLYLVQGGLKPVTMINPRYVVGPIGMESRPTPPSIKWSSLNIPDGWTNFFEEFVKKSGLLCCNSHAYKIHFNDTYRAKDARSKFKFYGPNPQTYIAKDMNSMMKIINANDDCSVGLAFGYPEEDVFAISEVNHGSTKSENFVLSLVKAVHKDIKLPEWLAYISFVPSSFDLINNHVSDSAKETGIKYMDYVRKNNPELSRRAEELFYAFYNKEHITITTEPCGREMHVYHPNKLNYPRT